jgi:hypothetical protein
MDGAILWSYSVVLLLLLFVVDKNTDVTAGLFLFSIGRKSGDCSWGKI